METTTPKYVFSPTQTQEWLSYLKQHGYVVIKGAVSPQDVNTTKNLLWNWLENLGSGIKRTDPKTWNNSNWPGALFPGFATTHGGGQIEAAWYLRSLPSVKNAFAAIWNTQDLAVSMDTFILWRPWWNESIEDSVTWHPDVEPIHCDQNPFRKRGFHCVQGMIPLLPVNPLSGGLRIVPDTNNDATQDYMREEYPHLKGGGDWCVLHYGDELTKNPQLLLADPGDLILWDSRTIHGGLVGTGGKEEYSDLVRASLTVCMAPKNTVPEGVANRRQEAHQRGWTLTHWPNEFRMNFTADTNGRNIPNRQYVPIELTKEQLDLLV
jgi:hypothetical protein